MNRTVKVTGFSWRASVRVQLLQLFSRVGQVQKVFLSPDKNAAFVRFEYKAAVYFALEQEWLLGMESLRIRPVVLPRKDYLPVTPGKADRPECLASECRIYHHSNNDNSKNECRAHLCSDYDNLKNECRTYSYSDYNSSKNELWVDFPHERFGTVPCKKRRKRKRFDAQVSHHFGGPSHCQAKKLKVKMRRKKKKHAYLESAASVPFGVTVRSDSCLTASNKLLEQDRHNAKQVFLKGDKTLVLTLSQCWRAEDVLVRVAEAVKTPSKLLHITVGGRTLTDEVAADIEAGSTLHVSVRGLGGADSEQQGNSADSKHKKELSTNAGSAFVMVPGDTVVPMSKSARKKQRKKVAKQLAAACVTAPGCPDDAASGDGRTDVSVDGADHDGSPHESASEMTAASENRSQTSESSSERGQGEQRPSQQDNGGQMVPGEMSKSKGVVPDDSLAKPVCALAKDASESDVQQWLVNVCGISPENMFEFDGMDGKTLYTYGDFESLLKDVNISYGKARTIIYRRDCPDESCSLLTKTVDGVVQFIHDSLKKPHLDLHMFHEKEVDGVVFMSFADGGELKRDLGLHGVIARRIIEERSAFIMEEAKKRKSEESLLTLSFASVDTDRQSSSEKDPQLSGNEEPVDKVISLEDNNGIKMMFIQNALHLQCLHLPDSKSKALKQTSLKILRVKESQPSLLDKSFLFCVLVGPDFKKTALPVLWKNIKNHTHDLWKSEFEKHGQCKGKLEVQDSRLLLDGAELLFSKTPTPTLVSLVDFEKDVGKRLEDYPIPVLLVDKQLLKVKDNALARPGYVCKLSNKKDSMEYYFGFDRDRNYWAFDSEDFGCGIEECRIPENQIGCGQRCRLQWTDTNQEDPSGVLSSETENGLPVKDDTVESDVQSERNPALVAGSVDSVIQREKEPYQHQLARLVSEKEKAGIYIPPRDFKHDPKTCRPYEEGICLRVLESAHGMIHRSVELKFYESEVDTNREKFLLKSLKFVCGCLNSRRNGTIYFGVPEGDVKKKHFEYGEVYGVNLSRQEQDDYYTAFHKHLDVCFSGQGETVKKFKHCVHGPYFVQVKTCSSGPSCERCVIEIDVEPCADLCQQNYFRLPAGHINSSLKGDSGVYVRDTGIKDGTVQTRKLSDKELDHFVTKELPVIAEQRHKEEVSWTNQVKIKIRSEGSKLKRFIENCDESVSPILLISKPTESVRQNLKDCLKFVKFIPWAAVIDFDYNSTVDGLFSLYQSSPSIKDARMYSIKDFAEQTVEKQREMFHLSSQVLWFFANGSAVEEGFEHLQKVDWCRTYYPHVKAAVTFLQNPLVISKQRQYVFVLVSTEMEDDIVRTVDDFASFPNIGLEKLFFVFDCENTRSIFVLKSSPSVDVTDRSAVLPWQDVQRIVNQVLDLGKNDRHKLVATANESLEQIPPHQWIAWSDLYIISADECEGSDSKPTSGSIKASQEEIKFYRGGQVSWFNFYYPNQVMERSIQHEIESQITALLQPASSSIEIPKVVIYHMPGTGGTTLGKHLLWKHRKLNKCAVIERITQDTFRQICEFWEAGEISAKEEWKPVILLSDNNTSEELEVSESELCAKLFRQQKHDRLLRPIAVLIVCRRSVRHGTDGFSLKQKLGDDTERMWMESAHKRLEGKKNLSSSINTFLGFLSIRHEFDLDKLESIVLPYLFNDSLSLGEKDLIACIALIMKYFPPSLGLPGIPVSSCDNLLNQTYPWDRNVSGVASVLLLREYNPVIKVKIVRIANKAIAEVILKTVREADNLQLADIVVSCFHSLISNLDQCEAYSAALTVRIVISMLIERFDESGSKLLMSPLIMDVLQESSLECAVRLLELGHQHLGGEVFYQQLARLYTNYKKYEEAVASAKKAISLCRSDAAEFKHTLGYVYLNYFKHLKELDKNPSLEVDQHRKELTVAMNSLNTLSEAQGCNDAITKSYASCDKMKIITALLHFIIDKLVDPGDYAMFGRFLTEKDFEIEHFDTLLELKEIVKNILRDGLETLRYMYNFGFSYKHSSAEEDDARRNKSKFTVDFTKGDCIVQFKTLATILKRVVPPPPEGTHFDWAYRIENHKLRGSFFESICYFVLECNQRNSHNHKKNRNQLRDIKANLDIIGSGRMTTEDMDNYITVCLAIELIAQNRAQSDCWFSSQRSRIYKHCNSIITANDDPVRTMRAHMYRVLVCWPTWRESKVFSRHDFLVSFHNKATLLRCKQHNRGPMLASKEVTMIPLVHFFIAKMEAPFHLCHWSEIFEPKQNYVISQKKKIHSFHTNEKEDDQEVTEDKVTTAMHQKLQPFEGYCRPKGHDGNSPYFVEFKMGDYSDKLDENLSINYLRGEKVYREARVRFYLGFSLQGPVAYVYNILPEDS